MPAKTSTANCRRKNYQSSESDWATQDIVLHAPKNHVEESVVLQIERVCCPNVVMDALLFSQVCGKNCGSSCRLGTTIEVTAAISFDWLACVQQKGVSAFVESNFSKKMKT